MVVDVLSRDSELNAVSVVLGSIYLTLQNIISTIIGIFGYTFMARMITQEQMGAIAGLTFIISLVQLLSDFGLNASIAKFVSELKGRREDSSKYIFSALSFRIILSLPLALMLFLFSNDISKLLFKSSIFSSAIKLIAIDSIFISFSPLLNSILWGSSMLKNMAIYGITSTSMRWLAIVFSLVNGYGLNGVIIGWIIGDIVFFFMLSLTTSRFIKFNRSMLHNSIKKLSELLKFSWPIYVASITSFLYTWYDRALVLAYLSLTALGIYNVAYTAFSVLVTMASSLGSALFPYYGIAYGKNDQNSITLGIKRASRYTMLILFPLIIGLIITSKPVITLFAGQQYEEGWVVLAILSSFGLVYGISPAFSNLLLVYGKTKVILLLNLISIVISLAFLPLVWFLNLAGLAIVRGAASLITFLLSLHFLSRIIKIEIDYKAGLEAIFSSIVMAIVVIVFQQVLYSKFLLPLYIVLGGITYALMIRLLKVINKEDIQLIQQITGEKLATYMAKILGFNEDIIKN